MIKITKLDTPIGEMAAAATREGICLLEFTKRPDLEPEFTELALKFNDTVRKGSNRHLRVLKRQLREYFRGKRKDFILPLIRRGTDFQLAVWDALMKIPYGMTISYQEQARKLGNPGAVRAVAGANGSNRIAIIIPCHRVIGADGDLVGYSGGLDKKNGLSITKENSPASLSMAFFSEKQNLIQYMKLQVRQRFIFLISSLLIISFLAGCARNEAIEQCLTGHRYGFLGGLWHGFIAPFDFIGMLFSEKISMYAPNNNGGFYALGFLIGSGGWGFMGSKGMKRIQHRRVTVTSQKFTDAEIVE
jgi:O-6-methylguanine DNA methyltransferase